MMSEYLLSTGGLTKQFGKHKAVNDVNLHVKKGAIYGFIGRLTERLNCLAIRMRG